MTDAFGADLIVPRERIDKGLHPLLHERDLTGLMLANLCVCNKALMVDNPEDNKCTVSYDIRLAKGIPCFFDLVAHLIWHLRQPLRSLRSCPFDISFISARNIDLDQMVDGEVSFVAGAQEYPGAMTVTDAPVIDLSQEELSVPFKLPPILRFEEWEAVCFRSLVPLYSRTPAGFIMDWRALRTGGSVVPAS